MHDIIIIHRIGWGAAGAGHRHRADLVVIQRRELVVIAQMRLIRHRGAGLGSGRAV